jgi:hypothetical protein
MITDLFVFDDILNEKEIIDLNEYVKDSNIRWESLKDVVGNYSKKSEVHFFPAKVHPQPYCKNETINLLIEKIQKRICEKLDLQFVMNYRWKINWTTPLDNEYNPIHLLHYDRINEHLACVVYINNSTGDTFIYNNKFGDDARNYENNYDEIDYSNYILKKNISPLAGRCVVFNGNLAHHGSYPVQGDRYILNLNFVASKKIKSVI